MRRSIAELSTRLTRSRKVLVTLALTAVVALVATTVGYSAMTKTVTLSLDGRTVEVRTLGGTVEQILADEGVEVGPRDVVAPAPSSEVNDGSQISVRFARQLDVTVDGEQRTYWTTATDVTSALEQVGLRHANAALSVSRSAPVGRDGLALELTTPRTVQIKVGARALKKHNLPVLTVGDLLTELDIDLGEHDIVKPGLRQELSQGDKVVITRVKVRTERVAGETISRDTVEQRDGSMLQGETEVVREGRDGLRDVTYRLIFHNGKLQTRRIIDTEVRRQPVDKVVKVGTKAPPAPPANYASGNSVWDQLAQCESGGNWSINTGNGYYGGLQFSLSTWRAYGGPGYPHEQSRETQIAIATKLRDANGGSYGSWPSCASKLGLPR